MLQIVDRDLMIHEVPLEKICISEGSIKIVIDDITEKRKNIIFKPYQAVKITTFDCADLSFVDSCPDMYASGTYKRYLLEETESSWIRILKESLADTDDDFLSKSRHFILHLGDNLVEIVAWNVNISGEII
ncbi:MAG: hypothetical protein IJW70_11235 [Clostridia bacterium]|nr:hypothetical protein [Clostridia bacterium]